MTFFSRIVISFYFFTNNFRIHVVFGHVIQGQDVVMEIESQRVDSKSKPISEVNIANCGELIPKSRLKGNFFKILPFCFSSSRTLYNVLYI